MSEQLNSLKRRKGELAIKAARFGISTPPEVSMELSDLEEIIGYMERIEIHRRNIAHLLSQVDRLGTHTPPHIVNQAADSRREIAKLKAYCAQKRYVVADVAIDFDSAPEEVHAPISSPLPSDPITIVREKLRDVEALIRAGLNDAALKLVRELQETLR